MKKRVISVLLTLSLVLSLLPGITLAVNADVESEIPALLMEETEESGKAEKAQPDEPYESPGVSLEVDSGAELYTISDWVTYPVIGGNLYFDPTTGAIMDCDEGVTNAVIPDNINNKTVTSIGEYAFYDCRELTSITIPANVTSIERGAFHGCSGLRSAGPIGGGYNVEFGWTEEIPRSAFAFYSNLTSIIIPDGITGIGYEAFSGCSSLTSITIPASVTSIGWSAFRNCSGLTSAGPIGGGYDYEFGWTEEIPGNAFAFCSGLTNITIPAGITSIGSDAFRDCSGLTSAGPIGGGYDYEFGWTEEIPGNAFAYCSELTSVTIPVGIASIGDRAFSGCSKLTSAGPIGGGYDYEFGWTEKIPDNAFANCSGLSSIMLPNGITNIGNSAFSDCSGLINITLPGGVISIGDLAFYYCSGLTNITIPASVTYIGDRAFSGCSGLGSAGPIGGDYNVEFGWTEEIPSRAFFNCSELTTITIPDGVTSIGNEAFSNCSDLTSITIPASVTSIGSSAFSGCSNLASIMIPNGVTSIGDSCFAYCYNLASITIPDSVTNIGSNAFSRCTNLVSVLIPNNVENIGNYAFSDCSNLVKINSNNIVYRLSEGIFSGCTSLPYVTISSDVSSINMYALRGCSNLSYIVILNNESSYRNLHLALMAFEKCNKLTDIYFPGEQAQLRIRNEGLNSEFSNATFHYNSTGPGNVDPVDPPEDTASSVYFFSGWNPTTRNVSFDGQSSPYYLAASIDTASVDDLVGKYVLATVTTNPDSVLEIVNLQPVESSFGLVSSTGDRKITIDGTEYPVSDNYSYLEGYVGNKVLFHVYDGTIFGIVTLQEKRGALEHYDSGTDILTIDKVQYRIPYLVDISSERIGECLLKEVNFLCGPLNFIYQIKVSDSGEGNNPVPDFNMDIYRANWMQYDIPAVKTINSILWEKTPSAELVSNLQETAFDEAIAGWDAFDLISSTLDDPTALADFAAEPKDMYAAIILNALEASVSYDIVDSKIEDAYKELGKLISSIHNSFKTEWAIDIYDTIAFQNLSGEQREQVVTKTKSWFETSFGKDAAGLEFINQAFKGTTMGFETIGSIEDWCERMVSCYIVADTNEYLKAVLRQVYKDSLQGNNLYLKLALADCVEIMDSSAEKLMLKLINDEITVIGLKAGRYVIKECWSQVKEFIIVQFPAIAIFQQAYKNAKYASNLLFSTDDTIEQYLNMVAVSDIERLVDSSVAKLNRDFNQNKTISTAATYLTGVDFAFTLRDIDTQKAHGFADVLDKTWLNKIEEFLSGKDNFSDAKSYYRQRLKNYNASYEGFLWEWVDSLLEDYPNTGLYAYYQPLLDASMKRNFTKEFAAACPIDVYVYDQSDELAASIVDGRVSCFGDVMIALIDDTKIVRFYDNQDYRIEYVGTSAGEMDITVTEFNIDEEAVRTVNYYDVALTDGKTYTIDADNTILNATPYQLKDESTGKIVDYDYDSLLAKGSIKHAVSIQSGSMIQNGEILLSTEAVAGEKIEVISYVPEGATFDYWVSSNGDSIFADYTATSTTFIMPDEDIVIKAVSHGSSVAPITYIISFNPNGGVTNTATIPTEINGKLRILPTATRSNHTFTGWYTSPTGGEQITTDTIFSSDTTVYAHWAYNNDDTGDNTPFVPDNGWDDSNSNSGSSNGSGTLHSITFPSSVTGGKVTVNPQSAKTGDTVTITAAPDSGYELAALTATDSKGNELELTNKGSGKYTVVMPSGKVTVDVIFQPIGLPADSSASDWVNPFLDVSTIAWYYNAVRFASQSDLMNGVTVTQFAPDANLSRAQLAQILYNKEGTPAVSGGSPFTDVAAGTWYTNAVAWASAEGIVDGYGDGRFGPNDNITREQLAVMLWRYAEEPVASVELIFSDTSQISSFARPAICWAVENGILNGKGGNILDPKGFATRAEIAQMLKNYLDK